MTFRVPLVDLGAQYRALLPEMVRAVERVITSGQFVLGPEVERFEQSVARYLGAPHGVGVSSGSDALLVALRALGVGAGDEVVTTPFSFIATAESIARLGARPHFVDIDAGTLNLDVAQATSALSERTSAVVVVHLFGSPVAFEALSARALSLGVRIVEDAAQAFGARVGDAASPAGTRGAAGCFSFFPAKVLGALGDGGLVVTSDDAVAARCRGLRQHGVDGSGEHVEIGGNFRLDAIQAAALSVELEHVDDWIRSRRAHGSVYDAVLSSMSGLVPVERADGWNGAVYAIRVPDGRRDALRAHLTRAEIQTAVYYRTPLHLAPALSHLGHRRGAFPNAERAANEVLCIPIYPTMTESQQSFVIDQIDGFFR